MGHFSEADNTIVLAGNHGRGIYRGFIGEWAVSGWLNVECLAWERHPGDDVGYDVITPQGARADVKTTKRGYPLMVPKSQRYKVNPERTDVFILSWFDVEDDDVYVVGWTTVERFKSECHEDGSFPIPTLHMEVNELGAVAA